MRTLLQWHLAFQSLVAPFTLCLSFFFFYLPSLLFASPSPLSPSPTSLIRLLFSGVVSGNGFVCGLRTVLDSNTSTLLCWRFSVNGSSLLHKRIYHGPELEELEAGNSRICGVERVSRSLRCWQPFYLPRSDNYSSIALGDNFFCGLSQPPGRISCEGEGISKVPSSGDRYIAIAAGSRQACAITVDNDVECWGQTESLPHEKFLALAVGENRSCGIRWSNGTVVCWGNNKNFSLPQTLKDIHFTSIYAKGQIFCGVATKNYTLYCWGNENFKSGVFAPFQGLISQVVMPGPCRRECPYRPLSGSQSLCGNELMICDLKKEDGEFPDTRAQNSMNKTWSRRNIVFLVVGCVGTFSLLLVISFFVVKSHSRCRVHDSGRLDETRTIDIPKLEKRLSSLVSLGNPGQLMEFSIDELALATDGFSVRFQLGIGSFGSVYQGVLSDGRHVAIKRAELTNPTLSGTTMRNRRADKDSAFGVVLLELLSGHKAIHKNEDENPRNVVEYIVPYILLDEVHRVLDQRIPPPTPYEIEAVAHVGYLAAECLMPCSRKRPSMAEVVSKLESALAACLTAPKTETVSRSNTY
ncbi:unnamed protein product [Arabidopsis arenosa]|uniref:Uncharacterized protein n=1 Tax=Arabidopsis arenosa TaxID=38785 RepID=A0A8S2B8J5_ARAAE|nr:unnamed protein product [Arabidopsis arenosa]